jgi:hypothetical protein
LRPTETLDYILAGHIAGQIGLTATQQTEQIHKIGGRLKT